MAQCYSAVMHAPQQPLEQRRPESAPPGSAGAASSSALAAAFPSTLDVAAGGSALMAAGAPSVQQPLALPLSAATSPVKAVVSDDAVGAASSAVGPSTPALAQLAARLEHPQQDDVRREHAQHKRVQQQQQAPPGAGDADPELLACLAAVDVLWPPAANPESLLLGNLAKHILRLAATKGVQPGADGWLDVGLLATQAGAAVCWPVGALVGSECGSSAPACVWEALLITPA